MGKLFQDLRAEDLKHFASLNKKYRAVGDSTWLKSDFQKKNLKPSRCLFTPGSLKKRKPVPQSLEVIACISGLPFSRGFVNHLLAIQKKITEVLGRALHYWVAPKNLGLEYCVFKWPTDPWSRDKEFKIKDALEATPMKSFSFFIKGIQINPDGCVVAKGFDQNAGLFYFRKTMQKKVSFMPKRQSQWAHVPLGRILEPIGPKKFSRLKALIDGLANLPITKTQIRVMKLIHEKRWYMEKRKTLSVYYLDQRPPQS